MNPWTTARQASLSVTSSRSLLKLMSIESVMPSNHLILCHPLLLLPSIFPSIRVFSTESVLPIRWPKYWSFSFSISPSSEYSGLISFRIDWLDLLAVQGTLKSLLQHQNSKASALPCSASLSSSHPLLLLLCPHIYSLPSASLSCPANKKTWYIPLNITNGMLLLLLLLLNCSGVSDSVQPHRWQPTRLLCPQNSLGKNTGVGCHFLLRMECYSAIKRCEIRSFILRWMDLETIIQSEESQKEKNKYHILMHLWNLEKNGTNEPLLFMFVDFLGQAFIYPELLKFSTASLIRQFSCFLGVPLEPQTSGSNLGRVYLCHLGHQGPMSFPFLI